MPVGGEPVLVTDSLDDEDGLNRIDEIRFALQIPQTVAEVIKACGLNGKRIGLVGADALLHSSYRILADACDPGTSFEPADDILRRMRQVKSPAELEMARHASAVGVEWMTTTLEAVAAGKTEAEIVGEGIAHLIKRGGYPNDCAFASGPAAHRIWGSVAIPHWNTERRLQDGDFVHCDQWGQVNGYLTDFSRSTVVGGTPTDAQREVLEASIAMVESMIEQVRPGVTYGDLYRLGGQWLVDNGFAEFEAGHEESGSYLGELCPMMGHSVGIEVEQPWIMDGVADLLEANMVIAIEAAIGRPGIGTAAFEQVMIVHEDGVEVLTDGCRKRWWS